jgi:class 3 adenylate cyclase
MTDARDQVSHQEIEDAAQDGTRRVARFRRVAQNIDRNPALLAAARRVRQRLPGDERFGDPLSTAGLTPVEMMARGVSALSPERDSFVQEVGLAGLQLWQSLSEATGRGRGEEDLAVLFTDLVGFSSWALQAGDAATLELLREVGVRIESAVLEHEGRIVKRLGDGVMATFLDSQQAVQAALDAQAALNEVEVDGYRPKMRAGVHWGRPRKLGGDYLGVDVNIAARVADAAKADQVMVSDAALQRIEVDGLDVGKRKRLKADGAPRDMHVALITRG